MTELAFVAVLLLCVTTVALAVTRAYNRRLPREEPQVWSLGEHSDGELRTVYCECPGEEPYLIGAVPWASQDFEYQIEELRARGKQRLVALNSGVTRR